MKLLENKVLMSLLKLYNPDKMILLMEILLIRIFFISIPLYIF